MKERLFSEKARQALVRKYSRSGMADSRFCPQEGISQSIFRSWLKESKPILDVLTFWMLENQEAVFPKSANGLAIYDALQPWPRLENYLLDGCLEIDNNWIENKIRPLAIGRKNNWHRQAASSICRK